MLTICNIVKTISAKKKTHNIFSKVYISRRALEISSKYVRTVRGWIFNIYLKYFLVSTLVLEWKMGYAIDSFLMWDSGRGHQTDRGYSCVQIHKSSKKIWVSYWKHTQLTNYQYRIFAYNWVMTFFNVNLRTSEIRNIISFRLLLLRGNWIG